MRMNQRTANIIANITSSMGPHVRPKIIIKRASRSLQTGFSPTVIALMGLAFLLLCITLVLIGGLAWYYFKQKPKEDSSLVLYDQSYQLESLEREWLQALREANNRELMMVMPERIMTSTELMALAKRKDFIFSIRTLKDGISDASTITRTQRSQVDPLASPEVLEDEAIPIFRLMQEGKKSFSQKLMSSNQEDVD